ncbi:MAG: HtaA domain-containing protein [Gordonia sp. (in: high G+C Gram-positive bacteria)]|uniref:HtaA domain-containing protein n=1 Tax=Gordonia sp. (in: high G+C Gram-positive bacteria) TaxID=84139 RepID=UPI0039E4F0F8
MKSARSLFVLLVAVCTVVAGGVLPGGRAAAAPSWKPSLAVYLADGVTPAGQTPLHPGDVVVVKGTGYDPNANTSGLPVPVPPGVPHGTFIAFGGFAPVWRPSQKAPESSRALDRGQTRWAISNSALNRVPDAPFDMRRTIRQQAVPLRADGRFTARVTLTTPKNVPAHARWGIYTYGAADAVNASQEKYVPLDYSTAPGPNTPKPAVENLVWAYSPSFAPTFTGTTQGSVIGRNGSSVAKNGDLSFELVSNTVKGGSGELRYRGTIIAYTKFHLAEIALADPIIRVRGDHAVLSLKTSSTNMNGDDALRRIDIADLTLTPRMRARIARGENVTGCPAVFRPGITPELLQAVSIGAASPVNLRF